MQNRTKKGSSVYTGKVSNYDWSCNAGTITMDNGKTIEFRESNCIGFVNFNHNVNVSFKIGCNDESQLYEAYDIKMIKQDILDGYIFGIDYANGVGYIQKRYSGDEPIKFSRRSCKEFDRLVIHDLVTYSWHYGKKKSKIVNIKLNEEENIVQRNARGVVSRVKFYDNKEFILVFVYVRAFRRDVCVRLNGVQTKFVKGVHVRLDVFKDLFKLDINGHTIYGKYLRSDRRNVIGSATTLRTLKYNNNNNNNVGRKGGKAKIVKRDVSVKTENRNNGITWDSMAKRKAVSLNAVMEQASIKKSTEIQRQDEQDRQMEMEQEIMEERKTRNNEPESINKSINNIESNVDKTELMIVNPIVNPGNYIDVTSDETDGNDPVLRNNSNESVVTQDNDVKNDEPTKQEPTKKGMITVDMINDLKKRIHGLNIELATLVKEYKIQKYNEINQEIMDITSNCDFNSDFNESINDTKYSYASQ